MQDWEHSVKATSSSHWIFMQLISLAITVFCAVGCTFLEKWILSLDAQWNSQGQQRVWFRIASDLHLPLLCFRKTGGEVCCVRFVGLRLHLTNSWNVKLVLLQYWVWCWYPLSAKWLWLYSVYVYNQIAVDVEDSVFMAVKVKYSLVELLSRLRWR